MKIKNMKLVQLKIENFVVFKKIIIVIYSSVNIFCMP